MVLSLHKQPFVTAHFQFITAHFVRHCALQNATVAHGSVFYDRIGHSLSGIRDFIEILASNGVPAIH